MRRSFLVSFPLSTTFLFSAASSPSSPHSYNCYPNIIFPVTMEPQYLLPAHLQYYPVSFLLISFRLLQGSSYTQCLPFLTCLSYQLPANCWQPPSFHRIFANISISPMTFILPNPMIIFLFLSFLDYSAAVFTLDFFFFQTRCPCLSWGSHPCFAISSCFLWLPSWASPSLLFLCDAELCRPWSSAALSVCIFLKQSPFLSPS